MDILHTAVISRHFRHEDNVWTEEWIQEVVTNAEKTKAWLLNQWISADTIDNLQIWATDKLRTQSTAQLVANTLLWKEQEHTFKEKKYLNLEPESWPMKEILEKLDKHYLEDADIKAGRPADELVRKIQQNELADVPFNKFSAYYCTKLLNILNYIERKPEDSNFSITGIHWWYFFESVLYGLFEKDFPDVWEGQIRMGEESILQFVKTEDKNVGIKFFYRGIEKTITKTAIAERIQALREKEK